MKKNYLIALDGEIQERLEHEASKGILTYTTIIKMALSDFFESIDEDKKSLKDYRIK